MRLERLGELYRLDRVARFGHGRQESRFDYNDLGRTELLGAKVDSGTGLVTSDLLCDRDHSSSDAIAYLITSDEEIDGCATINAGRPDLVAEQTMDESAINGQLRRIRRYA